MKPKRGPVVRQVLRNAESDQQAKQARGKHRDSRAALRIDHLSDDQHDRADQKTGNSRKVAGIASPVAQGTTCDSARRRHRVEALDGGRVTHLASRATAVHG